MSSSIQPITFYDIPSKLPNKAWSPNAWKIRSFEYPEIAPTCIRIGAPRTATSEKDGSPFYTVPFIFDPNTNTAVSDSIVIAQYLDEQYPNSPPLFRFPDSPIGANLGVIQAGFAQAFRTLVLVNLGKFFLLPVHQVLNEGSVDYFRRTREEMFKTKLEDATPKKENGDWDREWGKVQKSFEMVAKWYDQHATNGSGEWVLGDTLSFADLSMAGWLIWVRVIVGEDSEYWKNITSWSGGRWGRFMKRLRPYERVV